MQPAKDLRVLTSPQIKIMQQNYPLKINLPEKNCFFILKSNFFIMLSKIFTFSLQNWNFGFLYISSANGKLEILVFIHWYPPTPLSIITFPGGWLSSRRGRGEGCRKIKPPPLCKISKIRLWWWFRNGYVMCHKKLSWVHPYPLYTHN